MRETGQDGSNYKILKDWRAGSTWRQVSCTDQLHKINMLHQVNNGRLGAKRLKKSYKYVIIKTVSYRCSSTLFFMATLAFPCQDLLSLSVFDSLDNTHFIICFSKQTDRSVGTDWRYQFGVACVCHNVKCPRLPGCGTIKKQTAECASDDSCG